jgi:hypothetical protein
MFTQDIFARNAVMVIGIDAVLVVIRGIRVTLMRLTMKKIIEHDPRKGIFFAQKYNISYLLFIYLGFIISLLVISLLVISPSIIYNHKKREDTHMSSLISILLENAYLSILYIY